MSKLWTELSSLPLEKLQWIAQTFHLFHHTFECFRRILQDQRTTLELFDQFQQTYDEGTDFFYHNPTWRGECIAVQSTSLHESACNVYNNSDLDLLERRLELQLHIMNAKIDDIIL